jgi:serine-type D-Ala-D-Ala carboxypeptidase (penicillin-binding protein 5/6)
MNSPLQGGQMRRSRRGRVIARRTRFGPRLLALIAISIVATAVWLIVGEGKTTDPSKTRAGGQPILGDLGGTSTRPPNKSHTAALPPGISLFGARHIRVHFKPPPRAGLVFDLNTGQVLWAHRPLKRLPIASLTKIMTAIIVTERTRPHERALITREALNYSGSGVGVLPRGREVPVEGLMAGMLLPSGNDAALALADHVAGHDREFVKLMNQRARLMGLGCTHYSSSYGLPDTNRSCAVDLARLTQVAMGKPRIARLVRKPQAKVRFPIKSGYLYVNSTNPLLRARFPGTIGLKTGSTLKAGHCFVGVVRRRHRTLGVVLLNSPNSLLQAEKLLKKAFRRRP